MEHALHLAAKHFVQGVNPTSAKLLLTKVKTAMANGDEVDIDALEDGLNADEGGPEDDGDAEEEFDVADTIGKALALVTQV